MSITSSPAAWTTPVALLITGDRELKMLGRYEENACFPRMLKVAGHKDVTLYELQGYGHGMFESSVAPMLRWMQSQGSHQGIAPKPPAPTTQQPPAATN